MASGGTLSVSLAPIEGAPGRMVELRIADTGPGIPPEVIDRIFDPHEPALAQAAKPGPLPLGELSRPGLDQLDRLHQVAPALKVLDDLEVAERSEEHTSVLQSHLNVVCRHLLARLL